MGSLEVCTDHAVQALYTIEFYLSGQSKLRQINYFLTMSLIRKSFNALNLLVQLMKYYVVIPTHNRMEKLYNLIASIERLSVKPSEIIVVDDASTDNSEQMVRSYFPFVRYFKTEKELWTSFTLSNGIAKARNELVYIIDDDNVVDDSSILPILVNFEQDKERKIGVIGPVTCWLKEKDKIMYAGAVYNRITGILKSLHDGESYTGLRKKITETNKLIEVDGIPNAFMLRRSQAIAVGLIPRYLTFVHDDGYLIYSIKRKLGKKVYVSLNSRIFHDYETTGRLSDFRLYYAIRNKILFTKKQYSYFRAIVNLTFIPMVVAYYAYVALKSDYRNPRIGLLMKALKDGILSLKNNGLVK